MNRHIVATGISITATLAAVCSLSIANAQGPVRPGIERSIKPGAPDATVNCCRCVAGKSDAVIDISTGTARWTVSKTPTAPPAGPYNNGSFIAAMPTNMSPQITPIDIGANPQPNVWTTIAGGKWLQPSVSLPNGHWTYVLKIEVPNCAVPQKVSIAGRIAADDLARMYVDTPAGSTQTLVGNPPASFAANGSTTRTFGSVLGPTMPGGFTKPGMYYIRVEYDNLGGAPGGMIVAGKLTSECSGALIVEDPKMGREVAGVRKQDCPDC